MDCIFCKIANGEIPCYKIFEDEHVLAFLDTAQDAVGHILVIPKKHCKNLIDCDMELIDDVFLAVKKISKHLIDNCGFGGVQVINNCNECAGQTVMHFHVHIVPRNEGDGLLVWKLGKKHEMDLEKICQELKLN